MSASREIVITGVGVVSPLGVGVEAFWEALCAGRSGIGPITCFDCSNLPVKLAAEVRDFDPMQYVKPRKSLKVMARDTQFGMTAAGMARESANLGPGAVDPERFGVVFSADTISTTPGESYEAYKPCVVDGQFTIERWASLGMANSFPLGMLKLLPNMIACHISIAQDARGHNNTLYTGELSSLLAISEAAQVIARGAADVMLAGGASSSRMQPIDWVRSCLFSELSPRQDEPERASRPFDLQRDGQVRGEGAAAFVLEERSHAQRRGAPILARLLSCASSCDPPAGSAAGAGLARAISIALRQAGLESGSLGHINANAPSTTADDRIEAQVLAEVCPGVPVTALKSYFGNIYSAGGAIETAASVLALATGTVPMTLNYEHPDPQCPVNVIAHERLTGAPPLALKLSRTVAGQAAAIVLAEP